MGKLNVKAKGIDKGLVPKDVVKNSSKKKINWILYSK